MVDSLRVDEKYRTGVFGMTTEVNVGRASTDTRLRNDTAGLDMVLLAVVDRVAG
jgi:hypothetical protein